ncbi:MAG: flavin reductase family protein [Moraxellaceae bacterium]
MLNLNLIDQALKSPLARILSWPHSPESYLEFLAPQVGGRAIKARVKAVHQQTSRAVSLVLEPNHRWDSCQAGQYVTLTVSINGRRHSRCFTVSHVEDGCPVVTIQSREAADDSEITSVSRWANESVWVGDSVEISAGAGDFVLPAKRPERFLFIAGGSGITPIRALTDELVSEGYTGQIDILYYVPTKADAIFLRHLEAVTEALPNIRLHLVCTREKIEDTALRGYFSEFHLASIGADLSSSAAYVCGPSALIEAVENHWQEKGQATRLTLERFQAAARSVAVEGEAQPVLFSASNITSTAPGMTLLETAEGAGLSPMHGCRQGICRTCTCRKTSGQVRDIRTGEISDDGEEDIAICVSVPVTPVTLAI